MSAHSTNSAHTTNSVDTLITVAPDTRATQSRVPDLDAAKPSVAAAQFALIADAPYTLTSDDVIFTVWADRRGIAEADRAAARAEFFSKGQPCLRTSALAKTHGFGIHSDAQGRVALVPMESERYAELRTDGTVTQQRAMRSSRG